MQISGEWFIFIALLASERGVRKESCMLSFFLQQRNAQPLAMSPIWWGSLVCFWGIGQAAGQEHNDKLCGLQPRQDCVRKGRVSVLR